VAIVGLGHVGLRLAELLTARGAELLVCDIDQGKAPLAGRLGARWITEEEALTAPVDVLCPCALGGTLDHGTVPRLGARVVVGAANNQLAAPEIADLLVARGVTWAPDFVANAGGVVNIAQELHPDGYDAGRARAAVAAIGDTMRTVLQDARARGITPLQAAMELARARLAEGRAAGAAR
jgi:leucine dehydrogenase